MSVYTISNKYLDKYDPFWISRMLALKVGAASIILCLINMFLKSPSSPTSYMMTALVATLASEILPSNTLKKKILIFVLISTILTFSQIMFGLFSYFRFGLFSFVVIYSYLVLRFLAYNPKAAVVPTLMILWGFIALEGGEATDLNAVLNSLLYSVEYSLGALLIVCFSPSYKDYIFLNATKVILKKDISSLDNKVFKNSDEEILGSLNVIRSTLKNLPNNFSNLYSLIIKFQYDYFENFELNKNEKILISSILSEFINSIDAEILFNLSSNNLSLLKELNIDSYTSLYNLLEGYNTCKV